jgi:dTDP-glucose 4,6-dehydratase
MTSVLVTGGAGFIGTNLVNRLAATTEQPIVVLDALTYAGDLTGIMPLIKSKRITLVHGDITDARLVEDTFASHAVRDVVHLAAESHVDRSIVGAAPFIRTNVMGTMVLLEAARAHFDTLGDCQPRFIHVSTDEVFGDLTPNEPAFSVESTYSPSSPYAASKASSDHLARAWARTYDLPVIVTNCGNNYGPWQFPEKLVPLMILNAIAELPLPVYGDGQQIRDWIHVDDHVDALLKILDRGELGATYLIGAECERSNFDIVNRICATVDAALGRNAGHSAQFIEYVTDRPGHDRRYALTPTSTQALGWNAVHDIDVALAGLVDWYLQHTPWCDGIRNGEYRNWYSQQYPRNGQN